MGWVTLIALIAAVVLGVRRPYTRVTVDAGGPPDRTVSAG